MKPLSKELVLVVVLMAIVLFLCFLPYFIKGWMPFSEFGYSIIWGDWTSDRFFMVKDRIIPEWNANYIFGVNYIGRDPFNSPLSLGNIFMFIFKDPKTEWIAALFFYIFLMGTGMYCFLRKNSISEPLSILGALLFITYPKWTTDLYHGSGKFVTAYSMVPWLMILIRHFFDKGITMVNVALIGLLGAIVYLGSGGTASIIVGYLLSAYYLYNIIVFITKGGESNNPSLLKIIMGTILGLILALGLSAYLLYPLWHNITAISQRSLYGLPSGYGLIDFAGMFFPWLGRLFTMGYYDMPVVVPSVGILNNIPSYFGILAVPFFLYVLSVKELRSKYNFYWIFILLFAFLFSKIGYKTVPVIYLFEKHLGAQTSEPFMFFCFMFCIIILIVASLDKMYGDYKCGTRRKPLLVNLSATLLMFFYAAVIIVWVTAKTLTAFYPIVIENLLRSPLLSNLLLNYNYKIGIQLILYSYFYDIFFYLFLASFLSRLLILWWFKSGRFLKERYGFIFLCVLMLMDFILMWSLYYPLNDIHDLRYSDRIRQNAFIGNVVKPTERIASFHKELKAPYKLEKINDKLKNKFGENPVFNPAAIYEEYNRQNYDSGFYYGLYDPGISYYAATVGKQSLNFHSSLFPDYFWDFDKALNKNRVEYYRQSWIALYDPYSKLADVAGLKYIFWYEPLTGKKFKLRDTYPVGNGYIYENTQAVPKAYLVSNLEYYDNRKRLLERMAEDTFDPLKTAVTEDKELSNVFTPNDNATGEVTLTKYSTNEILMKTHTDGKALLVVNDLYYPYWRAEVDGKETKIYRVNGVFRAVVVDSGSHGVVMKFYNTHFHKGIKISVAALILTITLLLAGIILRMKKK